MIKEKQFYDSCKSKITYYISQKKFEEALKLIRFCAQDKYYLNDILFDEDLENHLSNIANSIGLFDYNPIEREKRVVIFYDQVSLYGRVLSRVYLEGLNSVENIKLVYISYKRKNENENIYKYCIENQIEFYDIGDRYSFSSLKRLIELLYAIKPNIIFSQNHADDFVGVIANLCLNNTARRYLINITDHAFWIGKNAYDKIIEFRDFGASVSVSLRKISETKLVKLPYYAADTNVPFQGFPFESKDKRIILSGGSLYKVQGSDLFFEIVRHILDEYNDTLFYFLGNGCKEFIFNKLSDPRYENRIFVDNERPDLDEVIRRSYIYLNTYPLIGGLMTLFSMKNGVVPYTLVENKSPANDIRDFVLSDEYKFYFNSFEGVVGEIDDVLSDPFKHKTASKFVKENCINKKLFDKNLSHLIFNEKNDFSIKKENVDYSEQRKMYLASYNYNIPVAIFSCRSMFLFFKHPFLWLKGLYILLKRKYKNRR